MDSSNSTSNQSSSSSKQRSKSAPPPRKRQRQQRRTFLPPPRLSWPAGGSLSTTCENDQQDHQQQQHQDDDLHHHHHSTFETPLSQPLDRHQVTTTTDARPRSTFHTQSSQELSAGPVDAWSKGSRSSEQALKSTDEKLTKSARGILHTNLATAFSSTSTAPKPSGNISTSYSTWRDHHRSSYRITNQEQHETMTMMWVDKYHPKTVPELCVAPKKVKEVQDWLLQFFNRFPPSSPWVTPHLSTAAAAGKLLILVGMPGIGKSTMIRVLAKDLGWEVLQWNDHHQGSSGGANGVFTGRTSTRSSYVGGMEYQSQLSSFEEFLTSAGLGYGALDLNSISNCDTSAADPSYFQKENGSFSNGGGERLLFGRKKRNERERNRADLKHGGAGASDSGAVILIEDIPNLHTPDAAEKFRAIMTQHIQSSNIPTVFIFSDVCEGKHKPEDLEKLIDPNILYYSASAPFVKIMQCHPVTKPKIKKVLGEIVKQEKIPLSSIPGFFYDEIHTTSGGDLRHAIMTLQFELAASPRNWQRSMSGNRNRIKNVRDTKLSAFHALGKLLYAKRQQNDSNYAASHYTQFVETTSSCSSDKYLKKGSRPPLEFVPEKVMDESAMGVEGAVSFLGFHSPEFFTDITDLSKAFRVFSDAALLLDRPIDNLGGSIFPSGYAASLASRAVADANRHPAPNKFRQFNAPKVFEVMKKKRGNDLKMMHLCKRLSVLDNHLSLGVNIGSSQFFVTDSLPYMKNILPQEVDDILQNLYSYARERTDDIVEVNNVQREWIKELDRQKEILNTDDIVDDSSSSDYENEYKQILNNPENDSSTTSICTPSKNPIPFGNKEIIVIED